MQAQNYGVAAAVGVVNQTPAGGGGVGQPRQRVRARRGQATDPHSIAERVGCQIFSSDPISLSSVSAWFLFFQFLFSCAFLLKRITRALNFFVAVTERANCGEDESSAGTCT